MPKALVNIVDCGTAGRIGASFRTRRFGPEQELIDWFLSELPFEVPRNCKATLFLEPRLDSGYPDLVLVFWHVATMERWAVARARLKNSDLQLLQYLIECGPASETALRALFHQRLASSLARLEEAQLVRQVREQWTARSLTKSFAVRQIIAIEAKVANWQSAVQQAHLNTWFTPESYVLMPRTGKGHPLLAAARTLGIGVLSRADGLVRKPRSSAALPRSYASWLFNEWAWRSLRNRAL